MSRPKLGELLIAERKIDDTQLRAALAHQKRWGKKLGLCMVELGFLTEMELVQSLSRHLRLPVIDITRLDSSKITRQVLDLIPLLTARKTRVVPLAIKDIKKKNRLVVASSDPTNFKVFDEIQFKAGLPMMIMISPDSDIDWFIRKYYLSESEVIPQNYVSGISLVQFKANEAIKDQETFDKLEIDPISNIFFDEQFTGSSKVHRDPSKKDPNSKD